jgi:hypothetical protein
MLPKLKSVSEISDINEVSEVCVYFTDKLDAETFLNKFPKSYKGKLGRLMEGEIVEYFIRFRFNTFFMNESTGEVNETAFKNRIKVLKKLEDLN